MTWFDFKSLYWTTQIMHDDFKSNDEQQQKIWPLKWSRENNSFILN